MITQTVIITRTIIAVPPTSIYTVYDTLTVTATTTQVSLVPTTIVQPPSVITITPPLPTVYSTVREISVSTLQPTVTILPTTVTRFISKTGKPFHHFNYYSNRRNVGDIGDGNRTVALPSVFEQFLKKERETRRDWWFLKMKTFCGIFILEK